MIKVKPKDIIHGGTHFSFICETQEEMDWLKENQDNVLDRFVQGNFNNIGHLNVRTYKDYQAFGKGTLQENLEDYEGHACRDFGNLERINAGIIRQAAMRNMGYTPLTCANLERLVNDMFSSSYRVEPAAKVCDYLESLGCTIVLDKHAGAHGEYISVFYNGTKFGRISMESIFLYLFKPSPAMEFFKFSPTLLDDEKFKSTVDTYISAVKNKLLQQENPA